MINFASCDLAQFTEHMVKKFGQDSFNQGFEVIKANNALIFENNGEEALMSLIGSYFGDEDSARSFLNYCTTFMIVQNMRT